MQKARILLADDNSAVLHDVGRILVESGGFDVVAAVNDGDATLREFFRLRPDILILDISMGDHGGIEVAEQLRESGCRSKVIFLTVHEDPDYVKAAMGAGASAYVVKSRLCMDLIPAIDAVLSGGFFVSGDLLSKYF